MDLRPLVVAVLAVAAVWIAFLVLLWVLRPKGTSLRELVAVVPDILRLLRDLVGDRTTPLDVRIVIVVLVAWIVSPIDLIPEFIPVPRTGRRRRWSPSSRCATCGCRLGSRGP